jgi:hypothetical protein
MLDRLPAARRLGKGVDGDRTEIPVDPEELLQVGHFAAKRHTAPQRLDERSVFGHLGIRAEEGTERVIFLEVVRQEIADIARVECGETIELEARDSAVAEFHLGHGRAGHLELSRDPLLGHKASLP